jgi:hypothetical protein
MATSTAVVLAMGGIVLANEVLVNNKPLNFKVPLAIGLAALGLGVLEKAEPELAIGLAWMAFITAMVAPIGASKVSPVESILHYMGFV